jgi:hypothetical protein
MEQAITIGYWKQYDKRWEQISRSGGTAPNTLSGDQLFPQLLIWLIFSPDATNCASPLARIFVPVAMGPNHPILMW